MKILFTSNAGSLWGAERSLLELADGVRQYGILPHLACPADGPLTGAATALGIPVHRIPTPVWLRRARVDSKLRSLVKWTQASLTLGGLLSRLRFDLVHANTTPALTWTGPAAALTGVPCVWHWRDFYELGTLNRILARMVFRSIAVSDASFRFAARELGTTQRLVLIRQGVAEVKGRRSQESRDSWRASRAITRDEIVVLLLGQPIPRKGHESFVRALASARRSCLCLRGIIVPGLSSDDPSGYLSQVLDLARSSGCGEGLVLEPATTDVGSLLEAVDILAVPSVREPFGRVAVEGMLARLPVVASDVDGLASIVAHGETGFLTPAGDSKGLAHALIELARDRELRTRLGTAGRLRALSLFSAERSVRETVEAYRSILREARRPEPVA